MLLGVAGLPPRMLHMPLTQTHLRQLNLGPTLAASSAIDRRRGHVNNAAKAAEVFAFRKQSHKLPR